MKRHLLSAADLTRDGRRAGPGDRRGDALAGRPADQEAARAARPHRGQPVLRGLHPHPDLLRGRRQAALGRRHQLLRQGLLAVARASRLKDTALTLEAMGADAVVVRHWASRRPAPAGQRRLGRGLAWSTPATAPTSTRPRRCSTRSRCGGTSARNGGPRRPPGRDRRRRAAQPGGPLQRAAAAHARRRGHPGRAADAAAGRASRAGPVETSYDLDAVLPKADAVMMLRVQRERMNGGVLPDARGSTAAATASTAAGWPPCRTTRS